jgi:hypothetical protein
VGGDGGVEILDAAALFLQGRLDGAEPLADRIRFLGLFERRPSLIACSIRSTSWSIRGSRSARRSKNPADQRVPFETSRSSARTTS